MSQAGLARISSGNLPPQVPIMFVTDSGTATPALGILQILGVSTVSGSVPVSTSAPGSSNIVDINIQRSQAIAATDATKVGLAAFNSAQFTVDANGFVSTSGTSIGQTITGNTGGALSPTAGNWNIVTANSTVLFAGSGSTLTLDFSKNNLILGTNPAGLPGGNGLDNVGLGFNVLNSLTSGTSNTAVGYTAMQSATTANSNSAYGFEALLTIISGNNNSAFGSLALGSLTTPGINANNTGIGVSALQHVQTGVSNIGLGFSAGISYLTSESSNIVIGNAGVAAESNVIRIGTQGTGAGQQSQTFIAGVVNTVSGRVVKTTVPGAYPYTTLTTDYVILVDTSSARTINLVASPVTGTTYRIKDNVGSAAANNITITPAAGTIDGAASYVISSNWGSVDLVYNSTAWRIL